MDLTIVRSCLLLMLGVAAVLPAQVSAQGRAQVISRRGVVISPGTRHPTPENIPSASDPRLVLYEETNADGTKRVFLDEADGDPVSVGVNEGEHHEMFGYIKDVVTDGLETLYILDSEYNEVRVLDFRGNFLDSFGGPGEGPGEFRIPQEIAVTGRTIFVIDGLRVSVFERQESSFVLEETFTVNAPGMHGLCAMNGYLYTVGYSPGMDHVIHKWTRNGTRMTSFGEPYSTPNEAIRESLSAHGLLACSEKHGIVGWIRNNIPVLTAYTGDGKVVWRARLADFKPMGIVEGVSENGAARIHTMGPRTGEGYLHTLFSDEFDDFYLGYYTETGGDVENHVFRVDVRTGDGQYLGLGNVSAMTSGHIFVGRQQPFPQVMIYKQKDTGR